MIELKQYGYIEAETPPIDLIPGRVTELQRDQYTVITEQGEVTAVLKGAFYHVQKRENKFVDDKSRYLIDKRALQKTIAMQLKGKSKNGGYKK